MKVFKNLLPLVLLISIVNLSAQENNVRNNMRMPFTEKSGGFITDWLIVGGLRTSTEPMFDFNFLETKNEGSIFPHEGAEIKNGVGTSTWRAYKSRYSYINLFDALNDINFYNGTAYAYAEIEQKTATDMILSYGSHSATKIWLNGELVEENPSGNGTAHESVHKNVKLREGKNRILVKTVHSGWTWGFRIRFIDPDKISMANNFVLSPRILEAESGNGILKIQTDRSMNPYLHKIDVNVKVRSAGGGIVAEKNTKRNSSVEFKTDDWSEGSYDICFVSEDNKGNLITSNMLWYKGDPLELASELVHEVPEYGKDPTGLIHKMLKELLMNRMDGFEDIDRNKIPNIYPALMEYEEIKLGADANKRSNGFIRLAWIDPIDGTPQFCRVNLPLNYDPQNKYPLVIKLHGYNPSNPKYINWWSVDKRHNEYADRYNIIYAEPHGRGNTGYRGLGELDVIRCVEKIIDELSVDEDRVYLTGDSMGGGGTWWVGTRHPEIFAAIAPIYGGWDYHVIMDKDEYQSLSKNEKFFNEKSSSYAQADALLTTPVMVFHGDIDAAVNVEESRYVVKMLQRWGYEINYHEFPGFGHEGIDLWDELIPWLLKHKRNYSPKQVRLRSAELRTAQSHWVQVTQRKNPFEMIKAEVEVFKNNTIQLTSENVLQIELSPGSSLISPLEEVKIIWNTNDVRYLKITDGKIVLDHPNYIKKDLHKTPLVAGPMEDFFNTPFALVIGTISGDETAQKLINLKSQEFISYWKDWQKFEPRVFKDTEITDEQISSYSLILYGGAEENLVTKSLINKVPLKIEGENVMIGRKKFSAPDACVQMLYPNPTNNDRYIRIIAGTSPVGLYFLPRNSNNYDFVITDGTLSDLNNNISETDAAVVSGIFDHNWEINEEYLKIGDAKVRNNQPKRIVNKDLTTEVAGIKIVSVDILKSYVGNYKIAEGFILALVLKGNTLNLTDPSGRTVALYPKSETEFRVINADVSINFDLNESNKVTGLTIFQGGDKNIAEKIK
ncbi:MAG: prolyl oligopeptidase family serine peptidase [Melioribacteraceae bacterium]|nr:prolyl oligopeptidase family serine peptidase [Melioribacteraceae bacterium]